MCKEVREIDRALDISASVHFSALLSMAFRYGQKSQSARLILV